MSHLESKGKPMADSILRFPGFIVAEDRNTILKDGKRYKSIKALIADLPYEDCKRTYEWRRRAVSYGRPLEVAAVLDYRARKLRNALYGEAPFRHHDGAA